MWGIDIKGKVEVLDNPGKSKQPTRVPAFLELQVRHQSYSVEMAVTSISRPDMVHQDMVNSILTHG